MNNSKNLIIVCKHTNIDVSSRTIKGNIYYGLHDIEDKPITFIYKYTLRFFNIINRGKIERVQITQIPKVRSDLRY